MSVSQATSKRVGARPLWLGVLACLVCAACSEEPIIYPRPRLALDAGADAAVDGGKSNEDPLQLDGEPCNGDDVCESGHCNNNVCCAAGECCRTADDCATSDKPGMCTDSTTCSGMKPVASCDAFQCRVRMGEDDSACDETVEADQCGVYKSVFCTGAAKQSQPRCPVSCDGDDACDPGAHCEGGECVPNAVSGTPCQSQSECASGNCVAGFCCDTDNCCTVDTDCDAAKYSKAVTCDAKETCQGSSGIAVCQNGRCGTKRVEDDSACNESVVANECSGGAKVYCRGGREQSTPPACATGMCSRDLDCPRTAFCDGGGLFGGGSCAPDLPNGGRCDRGEKCQSGHCSNSGATAGVCCSYDCADTSNLCPELNCSTMMGGGDMMGGEMAGQGS